MHSYEIREYNNELLRSYNYVFNEHLPLIEEITNIQSIDALVYRIDILHMLYTISLEGNKAKDYWVSTICKTCDTQEENVGGEMIVGFLSIMAFSSPFHDKKRGYTFSCLWC